VIEKVFHSHKVIGAGITTEVDEHKADYGVVICDDREYLKSLVEGLLFGNFARNGNRWRFYRAYELDLPTMAEIKNFKALIIWSSTSTPSFKENPDGTAPSWIRPVIKMIKTAYNTVEHLKILGFSLG
jgi:hypothetical protein